MPRLTIRYIRYALSALAAVGFPDGGGSGMWLN
jgi:hypothetical protein